MGYEDNRPGGSANEYGCENFFRILNLSLLLGTGNHLDGTSGGRSISVDASEHRMNLAAEASVLQSAVDASETAQAGNSLSRKCFATSLRQLIAPR